MGILIKSYSEFLRVFLIVIYHSCYHYQGDFYFAMICGIFLLEMFNINNHIFSFIYCFLRYAINAIAGLYIKYVRIFLCCNKLMKCAHRRLLRGSGEKLSLFIL